MIYSVSMEIDGISRKVNPPFWDLGEALEFCEKMFSLLFHPKASWKVTDRVTEQVWKATMSNTGKVYMLEV